MAHKTPAKSWGQIATDINNNEMGLRNRSVAKRNIKEIKEEIQMKRWKEK